MPGTTKFDNCGVVTPASDMSELRAIVREYPNPICIEIGSWTGCSALAMISAGAKEVHCIDTWEGSPGDSTIGLLREHGGSAGIYETFCKNVGPELLFNRVHPHRCSSLAYASIWTTFQADVIFIDADHRYEAVKADIAAWWPHVRDGGTICGHDHSEHFPGVPLAVREAFGDGCGVPETTIWKKRKPPNPTGEP